MFFIFPAAASIYQIPHFSSQCHFHTIMCFLKNTIFLGSEMIEVAPGLLVTSGSSLTVENLEKFDLVLVSAASNRVVKIPSASNLVEVNYMITVKVKNINSELKII